jgi:hypothetical protein
MIMSEMVKALGYKDCLGLPRTPIWAYISRAMALCAVGPGLRRCDALKSTVAGFCRSDLRFKTKAYGVSATLRRFYTLSHVHAHTHTHTRDFTCRTVAPSYLLLILLKRIRNYCDVCCDICQDVCRRPSQAFANPLKNNKKGGF